METVFLQLCSTLEEVDAGVADEVRSLQVDGVLVELHRRRYLSQLALFEQSDLGGHGQGLDLVVGYVNDGCADLLVEALQLGTHVDTELCVQVGQRLVEEQQLGLGSNCTGDGHALLLTAGKLVGVAILQLVDTHELKGLHYLFLYLGMRHLFDLQTECNVVVNGHVGPQSVALEYQIQVTLAGFHIVSIGSVDYLFAINGHNAVLGLLKAGYYAQSGGLAAAGGAQQSHKVAIFDYQVQVAQNVVIAEIFIDIFKFYSTHRIFPPYNSLSLITDLQ